MKAKVLLAAFVLLVAVWPGMGRAEADTYDETQGHPLRVAAYLVHPVGFAIEWLLLRPLHWVVSQPGLDQVFGHRPHGENRAY